MKTFNLLAGAVHFGIGAKKKSLSLLDKGHLARLLAGLLEEQSHINRPEKLVSEALQKWVSLFNKIGVLEAVESAFLEACLPTRKGWLLLRHRNLPQKPSML